LKIAARGAAVRTMFESVNKVIRSKRATGLQGFSLNRELITDIFDYAKPLGHNEARENCNLGFGFHYYGAVRSLRPEHILVIGSGFGFSVVCLALRLKYNGKGKSPSTMGTQQSFAVG
jgi:hypothetical protein